MHVHVVGRDKAPILQEKLVVLRCFILPTLDVAPAAIPIGIRGDVSESDGEFILKGRREIHGSRGETGLAPLVVD